MSDDDLDFTVEATKPITVRVKARGKSYVLRLALGVQFVRDTGKTNEQGLPEFVINAGSTMHVEEEKPAVKETH